MIERVAVDKAGERRAGLEDAVVAMVRNTATGMGCPPALDPGVDFFGAPVQICKGGVGSNNFYGKGLVNALAASQ